MFGAEFENAGARVSKPLKLLGTVLLALATLGCIWDRDTIDDEMRGVPGDFDLLVGKWHRHTDAYYEHRIAEVTARLTTESANLELYDDLAVAHERLGDREAALAVLDAKAAALAHAPNSEHQYRYHANRGTVLAHDGRFAEAVAELERALAINPDAHFGRERLQVDALRYLQAVEEDPELLAEHNFLTWAGYPSMRPEGLTHYLPRDSLFDARHASTPERNISPREQFDGVAGMLRYGGVEGPELYRTLADLELSMGNFHHAWWGYKRAVERGHPLQEELSGMIDEIEAHWREARGAHPPSDLLYERVRAHADHWLVTYQQLEQQALAAGRDPGDAHVLAELLAETERRSAERPRVGPSTLARWIESPIVWFVLGLSSVVLLLGSVTFWGISFYWRSRSGAGSTGPQRAPASRSS